MLPKIIPTSGTISCAVGGRRRMSSINTNMPASAAAAATDIFTISVAAGVHVTTADNDVVFRLRHINSAGLQAAQNFSPLLVTDKAVSLSIGAGAVIDAGGIYFIAQAEDRELLSYIGADRLVKKFVIEPLLDKVDDLVALPVKVLLKQSTATIAIGDGAQILGTGTVGMYATATADASGDFWAIDIALGPVVEFGDRPAPLRPLEGSNGQPLPGGGFFLYSNGPAWARFTAPISADYTVRIRAWESHAGDENARLSLRIGEHRIQEFAVTGTRAPLRFASASTMPRSLRIHSTAKPKSNSSRTIVRPRFSSCQLCAAPYFTTSITCSGSRPAFTAKLRPSDKPCTMPAMRIWLTILVSWPAPAGPISALALA